MGIGSTLVLLAQADEWTLGHHFGAALVSFFLLLAVAKCVAISFRRTTSSICVNSLALLLLPMALLPLIRQAGALGINVAPILPFARPVLGLALVAAVVLSIVGLAQYRRADRTYVQGRKQAIGVLLLVGLFFAVGTYRAATRAARVEERQSALRARGPGETRLVEQFNLRFEAPPAGWVEIDPKVFIDEACLAYTRLDERAFFFLIAERIGVEVGMTAAHVAELARARLRSIDPNAVISDVAPIRQAGMTGTMFRATATPRTRQLCYVQHVFAHNGYSFRLVTAAPIAARNEIEAAASEMLRCFGLIDPNRTTHGDKAVVLGDFESTRYGYSIALPGEGWYVTEEARKEHEHEDFVALFRNACTLTVAVAPLLDASVPDEAVLRGMLALKGVNAADETLRDRQHGEQDGRREITFQYEYVALDDSVMVAHVRVVRTSRFVYLIQAARPKEQPELDRLARTAMARVLLFRPTMPPGIQDLETSERRTHGVFYNQVGIHLFAHEVYGKAVQWFMAADRVVPDSPSHVRSAAQCYLRLERRTEALELLNRNRDAIRDELDLLGDRAWLLACAGMKKDAMKEYAALFARGLRDSEDLDYYARLLIEADRVPDAMKAMESYRRKGDSAELICLHARLLGVADRYDDARALLEQQPEPRPVQIEYALVEMYEAQAEHGKALAVVKQLGLRGYESVWTFRTSARLEIAMDQLDDARGTIKRGLVKFPDDPILQRLGVVTKSAAK